MQMTVFGASGKVGVRVVELALKQGYTVVAFVHRARSFSGRFQGNPKLVVHKGDVRNPRDVEAALKGSKLVVSCLGSWGRGPKDVLSTAMGVIIPEMKAARIRRIISLTGAGALAPKEKVHGFEKAIHILLRVGAGKILYDGERHIAMLAESGLDWTVLRSPVMNNFGARRFRLSLYPPSVLETVRRQQVAEALLELPNRRKTIGKAPYILRG